MFPFDYHLPDPGVDVIDELREALIGQVKQLVEQYGEDISLADFRRETGITWTVIHRKFGTWGDLRVAAGLKRHGRRRGYGAYKTEDILEALKQLAEERGEGITQAEFSRASGISPKAIAGHFGTWGDLRVAAGLNRYRRRGGWGAYKSHDILDALKQLAQERGEGITQAEFTRLSGISQKAIARLFGSWAKLRKRAGLKPVLRRPPQFSDEQLLAEFHKVAETLGRIPTGNEFHRGAGCSMLTLYKRFGNKAAVVRRYRRYLRALESHR